MRVSDEGRLDAVIEVFARILAPLAPVLRSGTHSILSYRLACGGDYCPSARLTLASSSNISHSMTDSAGSRS